MKNIAQALAQARQMIHVAEQKYGRETGSVALLAVSKTRSVDEVRAAAAAGQRAFGENYAQEALGKIESLRDLAPEWHFIGPVQSNKTRLLATCMDWVHTVDRSKIARRLSTARPQASAPLNVCLQINISAEASKSGIAPAQLPALADDIMTLPGLRLRGLMGLPAPNQSFDTQRRAFAGLRELLISLQNRGIEVDTLSMGTTQDMQAAIAEGATIVRLGTAIFGPLPR